VPETLRSETDDLVVALTPEACYQLDRRGVPYRLTTDFGIAEELAALSPSHWQEQLDWIADLDELVAAHVPETKHWRFGAATLYAFNLKTIVDPVRVRALELAQMLDSCDSVILYRRTAVEPPTTFVRVFEGPSVTSRVLPLLAHARGLELEERLTDAPELDYAGGGLTPTPERRPLIRLGARLKHGYRRLSGESRKATVAERRLTLLFADFGYDLTYLMTRARERGHRCLHVVGDTVIERAGGEAVASLARAGGDAGWSAVADALTSPDHPLWNWPNGWIPGVRLADVIRPKVLHWLSAVMPSIAARAESFERLYTTQSVDLVLGADVALPDVVAAAAVSSASTQSVLIDHGHAAYASELFDLIMLRHMHHDFCGTSELARYMSARRALYDEPTAELHVGSYRWRASAALTRSSEPPAPVAEGKRIVVYALTSTAGNGHYLNSAWYIDGWYYRLCREIVDVLARHPEIHSVVKPFPGDGLIRNPIDLYVRDLGLDHVVSSRAPLQAWIPWADRIVFDLPSTGLFETAAAGVPYLGLLWRHHRHRPGAVEQLGDAAVDFTEPDEAARAVEAFVAASTVTAPRLPPEGDEILLTLERMSRK
jgi:hypothetical protein